MKTHIERMRELIDTIDARDIEYYVLDAPTISDREYDTLRDELSELEKSVGFVDPLSPNARVSGGISSAFSKVTHSEPMLSAQKVQDSYSVTNWISDKPVNLSWKLDGLTLVLTYSESGSGSAEEMRLSVAATRGDGITGENVLDTAKYIPNIPKSIPYDRLRFTGKLEIRGEVVLPWDNVSDEDDTNPRNIAAGTLRRITPDIQKCRNLRFVAYYISGGNYRTKTEMLEDLAYYGFEVVENVTIKKPTQERIDEAIEFFDRRAYKYPVDGLMFEYEDLEYGRSLGSTGHHDRCRMAFKWEDETAETKLKSIDIATTKSGIISMTAIFKTVELDGTKVSRAYLHNLDYIKRLQLGIGDTIKVYKSNMIIPQIEENLTRSGTWQMPDECPRCHSSLAVKTSVNGVENLVCTNDECPAKLIRRFAAYADKTRMNIVGLSEKTIETLIDNGILKPSLESLYLLRDQKEAIEKLPGFGVASAKKMLDAIDASRITSLSKFLAGCCIPNVGRTGARLLAEYCHNSFAEFMQNMNDETDFSKVISGFGTVLNASLHDWYNNADERKFCLSAIDYLSFTTETPIPRSRTLKNVIPEFAGKNIVMTGKLIVGGIPILNNREEFFDFVTAIGGIPQKSVSWSTDLLVIGDKPGATKLNDARRNGIQTMSFTEFWELTH